jgi:hypothetical protein
MPLKMDMQSNEDLKGTIEVGEGLGWALQEYHPEVIEDPKLKVLWQEAKDAMDAIMDYLGVDY